MAQSWQDLLFAHWPVPAGELRRWVPEQLPLDTFDGTAWIAVTPFRPCRRSSGHHESGSPTGEASAV